MSRPRFRWPLSRDQAAPSGIRADTHEASVPEPSLLTASAPSWVRLLVCAAVIFAVSWRKDVDARLDFVPTYLAAHLLADGEYESVYRALPGPAAVQPRAVTEKKAAELGVDMTHAGPYTNHPYLLSVVQPLLTRISFAQARSGLLALNTACIVWIAAEVTLLLGVVNVGTQLLLSLLIASSHPVLSTIGLGQSSMITLCFALAALRGWARGTDARSLVVGGLFALAAAAIKPWSLAVIAGSFVFRSLRHAASASAAIVIGLFALPHALYPRALMQGYTTQSKLLAETTVDAWYNFSLIATLRRCVNANWQERVHNLDGMYPDTWMYAVAFSVLAALALGVIAALRIRKPRSEHVIAALLALVPFASSIVWDHYLVFALPLAMIACLGKGNAVILRVAGSALVLELLVLHAWLKPVRRPASLFAEALPALLILSVAMLAVWLGGSEKESDCHDEEDDAALPT